MAVDINRTKATTIVANISAGGPITVYSWKLNGQAQVNNTSTLVIQANQLSLGQHTVSLIAQNDCGSISLEQTETLNALNTDPSIIKNGTFDIDTTPWQLNMGGGVGTVIAKNQEAMLTVTSVGTIPVRFYQGGIRLQASTKYNFKVTIRSNSSMPVEAYITDATNDTISFLNTPPWNGVGIPTTLYAVSHTFEFTTPASIPAECMVRFKPTAAGIYYFDNISLTPAIPGECPAPLGIQILITPV